MRFMSMLIITCALLFSILAQAVVYDEIFPYYAELCSVSQVKEKGGKPGGIGGHAALYIKGVCRDRNAKYPQIKVCNQGPLGDIRNPDSGTAISVDKQFRNINWMAVETRTTFLTGGLTDVSKLTREYRSSLAKRLADDGIFNGIELHKPKSLQGTTDDDLEVSAIENDIGETDPYVIAEKTVDTDYAMWFGRTVNCIKIPIPQNRLPDMVTYLNSLNKKYAEPSSPDYRNYQWSGYYDNCTHVASNAFAAIGGIKFSLTNQKFWKQLFKNVAIPINQFIIFSDLGLRGIYPGMKDLDFANPVLLYKHPLAKNSIINSMWLPRQPGTVVEHFTHKENELYNHSDYAMDLKSIPSITDILFKKLGLQGAMRAKQIIDGLLNLRRGTDRILTDKRHTDLRTNLEYFERRYYYALKNKPSLKMVYLQHPKLWFEEQKDFTLFYQYHEDFLQKQRELAIRALNMLQ